LNFSGVLLNLGGEDPITWERLKELMDSQYYPNDVKRIKEREFLSLKQGCLKVIEYTTRFNELSRFVPHQINTEERRMDHFEQGLRGDTRSLLAGQAFDNFQDLYQRAVKVARVLERYRLILEVHKCIMISKPIIGRLR